MSILLAGSESGLGPRSYHTATIDNRSPSTRLSSQGAAHKGIAAMITVDIHADVVCGGASDGSCTVWNLRTCRELARLTGHQQKVRKVR